MVEYWVVGILVVKQSFIVRMIVLNILILPYCCDKQMLNESHQRQRMESVEKETAQLHNSVWHHHGQNSCEN